MKSSEIDAILKQQDEAIAGHVFHDEEEAAWAQAMMGPWMIAQSLVASAFVAVGTENAAAAGRAMRQAAQMLDVCATRLEDRAEQEAV